jgi:hypothetical protein
MFFFYIKTFLLYQSIKFYTESPRVDTLIHSIEGVSTYEVLPNSLHISHCWFLKMSKTSLIHLKRYSSWNRVRLLGQGDIWYVFPCSLKAEVLMEHLPYYDNNGKVLWRISPGQKKRPFADSHKNELYWNPTFQFQASHCVTTALNNTSIS